MFEDSAAFLAEWHRIVAHKDLAGLREVLAEDVSLGAPPYWSRIEGRETVHHLLGCVIDAIEGFTYQREWVDGRELALEFTGKAGGLDLQGVDLISLDEGCRVRRLDVAMRPVNAVIALREAIAPRMAAFLAGRTSPAAPPSC